MTSKIISFILPKVILTQINIFIIIIFSLISLVLTNCDRETPINKSSVCSLVYCNESEFLSKVCTIDNSIIKTQWLTNIIKIGEKNFRYLSFITLSDGSLIFQSYPYPGINYRVFFGIKSNGHFYFNDSLSNKETPFYVLQTGSDDISKYEGEAYSIRTSPNGDQEFFLSLSFSNFNAELYDFENNQAFISKMDVFCGGISTHSFSHGLFTQTVTDNSGNKNYYYYFSFIYEENNNNYFQIKKYIFKSKDITSTNNFEILQSSERIQVSLKRVASCFQTQSGIIMCLYQDNNLIYKIIAYKDVTFSKPHIEEVDTGTTEYSSAFIKCIYFLKYVKIFLYYNLLLS